MRESVYWIVFKRSEGAELEAIAVPGNATVAQIDVLVGGVNWFGSSKTTSTEAKQEAADTGFEYRSPEYMSNQNAVISEFRSTL